MASFSQVQKAFTSGTGIEQFKCVATCYGTPCDKLLTGAQKAELTALLQKPKLRLGLDELRRIIWEVLCAYHQDKRTHYENQVQNRWRSELLHVDFSPRRSPRRRSDLSRSPDPVARQSLNVTESSSNSVPASARASSEPPLQSDSFISTSERKNCEQREQFLSASTSYVEGHTFAKYLMPNDVVESIENDSPLRGRESKTHSHPSSTHSAGDDKVRSPDPAEASPSSALDGRQSSSTAESKLEGTRDANAILFKFGSHDHKQDAFDFNAQQLDFRSRSTYHGLAGGSPEFWGEISEHRLRKIFSGADGGAIKQPHTLESALETTVHDENQNPRRSGSPGAQINDGADYVDATATPKDGNSSCLTQRSGKSNTGVRKSVSRSRALSAPPATDCGICNCGLQRRTHLLSTESRQWDEASEYLAVLRVPTRRESMHYDPRRNLDNSKEIALEPPRWAKQITDHKGAVECGTQR